MTGFLFDGSHHDATSFRKVEWNDMMLNFDPCPGRSSITSLAFCVDTYAVHGPVNFTFSMLLRQQVASLRTWRALQSCTETHHAQQYLSQRGIQLFDVS